MPCYLYYLDMKFKIIVLTAAISFTLLACNAPKINKNEVLSVSIDPQKYFLETIVKGKYDVNCVIPPGSNPESFDPTPSQMITLGKSLLYFKVGHFNFENVWIKNVQENNPHLSIVDCSTGIHTLEADGHDCGHDHGHGHSGADPHIWSSPETAKIMVANMYNAIVELSPDDKELFTANYNDLLSEISKTDSIIKSYIAKVESKSFIIYHPALSYYAHEYGLKQYTIEFEGKNPSPAQMKQLIDLAKEQNIKVVFVQQEFDSKNAETIAKEIGAKVVPVNLLSYYWSEEMIKIAKALAADE